MHLSHLLNKLPLTSVMLAIALSLGLGACGYQLRGSNDHKLPASISVYADDQQLANAITSALTSAQVNVTIAEQAVASNNLTQSSADMRFTSTKVKQEAVAYDNNGNPTHWRYSISTQMLLSHNEDGHTFVLQEHQQVILNDDSGAGSANDLIIARTWQTLYQAIAQRALAIMARQPQP